MRRFKVFIPAAGYGERLRPITEYLPKPLLPVLGRPLLERLLERLMSFEPTGVGMNLHYKADMIGDWIGASPFSQLVRLFHEESILGTGGALKNAGEFLRGSPFIVHNADIISEIDLAVLADRHISSGDLATLAVHDLPRFNNVWVDEDGKVRFLGRREPDEMPLLRSVAFTGIAVYSPEFLDLLPEGRSSVTDAWIEASRRGMNVGTVDFTGSAWTDAGSPDDYFRYVAETLRREGEAIFVSSETICDETAYGPDTIIEGACTIGSRAFLRRCLLMPGSTVLPEATIEEAIIGPGFEISLKESLKADPLGPRIPAEELPHLLATSASYDLIGSGGSDRRYFRMEYEGRPVVLMDCPWSDRDYERHLVLTRFFRRYSVPVPELIAPGPHSGPTAMVEEGVRRMAFFEDLGDMTLYSWLRCRRNPGSVEDLYEKAIDILVHLHTVVTSHAGECPELLVRAFDYDHLRWETDYFMTRFVASEREPGRSDQQALNDEFDHLARQAASFERVVVHRDFQSQNIMIAPDETPRVIDYQGARIGPAAYDLTSLLWDPYSRLEDRFRTRLVERYVAGRRRYAAHRFDETDFKAAITICSLQRHMQALGAYAFLSDAKGKTYFRKFVPSALEYLREETEQVKKEYPLLYSLVRDLHGQ